MIIGYVLITTVTYPPHKLSLSLGVGPDLSCCSTHLLSSQVQCIGALHKCPPPDAKFLTCRHDGQTLEHERTHHVLHDIRFWVKRMNFSAQHQDFNFWIRMHWKFGRCIGIQPMHRRYVTNTNILRKSENMTHILRNSENMNHILRDFGEYDSYSPNPRPHSPRFEPSPAITISEAIVP